MGEGLSISGRSDPDDEIEAVERADGSFTLGVLWHPEEDPGDRVVRSLVTGLG